MISITRNKGRPALRRFLQNLAAAVFWVGVWEAACRAVGQEILIASPGRVAQRLCELAREGAFWLTVLRSVLHVAGGFLAGTAAGVLLAVPAAGSRILYHLLSPLVGVVKTVPVVSFIILALVWIRPPHVPVFISFLIVLPVVWGNVTKGIAQTDRRLLQMARCYHFGAAKTVRYVYLPSVAPYFLAACTTGMGLAWKAGIAAEVLANAELSIGGRIYDSKIYMETVDLFAWTAVVVLMSAALEKLVLAGMAKAKEKLCGGGKADA